jgi:hypothetical protein
MAEKMEKVNKEWNMAQEGNETWRIELFSGRVESQCLPLINLII